MLEDIRQWGEVAREALSFLRRIVETKPEELPPEIARLPAFATQDEASKYLERAIKELDDWVVVALWARFEAILLTCDASKEHERKELKDAFESGKADKFPWLAEEIRMGKKIYDYRNYVAHGRRRSCSSVCSPDEAYQVLHSVLNVLNKLGL